MPYRPISIAITLLICISGLQASAQSTDIYTTILNEGKVAMGQDAPGEALSLWYAEKEYSGNVITDPRIGIAYIELVTELERKEDYEKAVEMYYWGLENPDDPLYEATLKKEMERLRLIAAPDDFKRWRSLYKENSYRQLGQAMINFWEWLDPTPNTPYNERLVEHWLRIAYGRKHFTRGIKSVYDADERADIYVRYGAPDNIRDGLISYDSGMMRAWIRTAYELRNTRAGQLRTATDSVSNATLLQDMANEFFWSLGKVNQIERQIKFQHGYPSYEVWIYEDREIHRHSFHPLIFIFGNDGDTGEFGLRKSVEDMMPNSSFRTAGQGTSIPSSFFLQMLYYQDLSSVDYYFEQAYHNLESRLYSMGGVNVWDSRQLQTQNQNNMLLTQLQAPKERSTLTERMPEIPMEVVQYRLLNERNEPYMATFLLSNPYRAYYLDQMGERSFDLENYSLEGTALGVDENNSMLFLEKAYTPSLNNLTGFRGDIDLIPPEITYFEVPQADSLRDIKFTLMLRHNKKDSTQVGNGLFKENLRAIGHSSTDQPDKLEVDRSVLQMGDLIVGTRESSRDAEHPFGFRVRPDAIIEQGQNLIVHLEVYHLSGEPGNPRMFQIDYLAVENMSLFKRIFSKREKVSLSLNFEASESQFRENLEVDTSPFEPGDYTLELRAREAATGREVTRKIDFTITPNPDSEQ